MQGEAFVTTFLLKHPERLEKELGAKKLCLVGIEVAIPELFEGKRKRPRADLVFRSGQRYFVVETKEWDEKKASSEAKNYASALKKHMKENQIGYSDVIPVGVVIKYPKGSRRGWLVGEPIRDIKG